MISLGSFRGDSKCGPENLGPNGEEGVCLGNGDMPCCSTLGWCGNTEEHCQTKLYRDYRVSLGKNDT